MATHEPSLCSIYTTTSVKIQVRVSKVSMASEQLTIHCDGISFTIDEATIRKKSTMVDNMLKAKMRESKTRILNETEYSASVVKRLIDWLQTSTYTVDGEGEVWKVKAKTDAEDGDDDESPPPLLNSILLKHVDVYGIAHFYDSSDLRTYAQERFFRITRYGFQLQGLDNLVKRTYQTTPEGSSRSTLRNIVCEYAFRYCRDLPSLVSKLHAVSGLQEFNKDMFTIAIRPRLKKAKDKEQRDSDPDNEKVQESDPVRAKIKQGLARLAYVQFSPNRALTAENKVLKRIVKAVPSAPELCPNIECLAVFPTHLLIKSEEPTGRPDVETWTINCAKCDCELQREVEVGDVTEEVEAPSPD